MNTQAKNKRIRLIMDLRNKGITDTNVLSAIERVPRDEFVPAHSQDQAWEDMALPIGLGQTISQPFVVATMSSRRTINLREETRKSSLAWDFLTERYASVHRIVSKRILFYHRYPESLSES